MMSIYRSYLQDDLKVFSNNLCKYDFSDFDPYDGELLRQWDLAVDFSNSAKLRSNGSTLDTTNAEYRYGPLNVLREIERILKYKQYHTVFLVPNTEGRNELLVSNKPSHDVTMLFDYNSPDWKLLKNLLKDKGINVIKAQPHTFLYLTSDTEFLDQVLTCSQHIHSLCTTDWEPFFRKRHLKVLVNNNCINWKTGVNFYTCEHNCQHFLPIFALSGDYGINLLNMANKRRYVNDDLFVFDPKPISCTCGRMRLKFETTHHCNTTFRSDPDLIEELKDHYVNLQFVRKEGKISVYYTTRTNSISAHDREVICSRFGEVEFVEGVRLLTGLGKYYPFWESTSRTISSEFRLS